MRENSLSNGGPPSDRPPPKTTLNPPPRSYAAAVHGHPSVATVAGGKYVPERSFHDEFGAHIFGQISNYHTNKMIRFSPEEMKELSKPFKFTLIGKFSHGYPTMAILRQKMAGFSLKGDISIGVLNFKHVLIRLTLEQDYTRLWSRKILHIDGFPMRLFKWTPTFNPKAESPFVPVWVKFPDLPIQFFDKRALYSIASMLGLPLRVDEATAGITRPSAARVCVEIDLTQPRAKEIYIRFDEMIWNQRIEFENVPKYCPHCKHVGHGAADCRAQQISSSGHGGKGNSHMDMENIWSNVPPLNVDTNPSKRDAQQPETLGENHGNQLPHMETRKQKNGKVELHQIRKDNLLPLDSDLRTYLNVIRSRRAELGAPPKQQDKDGIAQEKESAPSDLVGVAVETESFPHPNLAPTTSEHISINQGTHITDNTQQIHAALTSKTCAATEKECAALEKEDTMPRSGPGPAAVVRVSVSATPSPIAPQSMTQHIAHTPENLYSAADGRNSTEWASKNTPKPAANAGLSAALALSASSPLSVPSPANLPTPNAAQNTPANTRTTQVNGKKKRAGKNGPSNASKISPETGRQPITCQHEASQTLTNSHNAAANLMYQEAHTQGKLNASAQEFVPTQNMSDLAASSHARELFDEMPQAKFQAEKMSADLPQPEGVCMLNTSDREFQFSPSSTSAHQVFEERSQPTNSPAKGVSSIPGFEQMPQGVQHALAYAERMFGPASSPKQVHDKRPERNLAIVSYDAQMSDDSQFESEFQSSGDDYDDSSTETRMMALHRSNSFDEDRFQVVKS